ncbi:MAG: hypothetical protein KBA31_19625 [Alphaproteobacteria bacterium]|nr:hypothetical protein [Alphaproteobacteria bacterium]
MAPKQGVRPGATWKASEYVQFRLLAISPVRFRDRVITVYTIKAAFRFDPSLRSASSDVFSYNYEHGIIAYANLTSERFDSTAAASPRVFNST